MRQSGHSDDLKNADRSHAQGSTRLVRELENLDRDEESRLADEGLGDESWPTS
jgi:hypothetical protein